MSEYKPISEVDFYEKYKPVINHLERKRQPKSVADEDIASYGGAMYETYGEDVEYIRSLCKEGKENLVWTITDCDGELIVQTGCWLINRIGYIVTENPWTERGVHVEEDWD